MKIKISSSKAFEFLVPLYSLRYIFSSSNMKKIKKTDVLIMCHDYQRSFEINGKKYSPILDTVGENLTRLGVSQSYISTPYSNPGILNFNNSVNINGFIVRAHALDKLISIYNFYFNKIKKPNLNLINAWSSILKKSEASIVISIMPPVELCVAASQNKIISVDMQHGIISSQGYYSLNYREWLNQEGWPSYIATWNDRSKNSIDQMMLPKTKSINCGNLWVNRIKKNNPRDSIFRDDINELEGMVNNKITILVTLQWGDLICKNTTLGIPDNIYNIMKKNKINCNWWIRFHPVLVGKMSMLKIDKFMDDEFKGLKNVFWRHSTKMALPLLLTYSHLHITLESASTIEASLFGVPTALLGEDSNALIEWFGDLIDSGDAKIVENTESSIVTWIRDSMDNIKPKKNSITKAGDLMRSFDEFIVQCLN